MAKRRIVIVGGGIAGLSAALALTQTEQLRQMYDVTIYQMGWRLGGKLASGRDAGGRNLEHGLHIWFGFYENAFDLMRRVYDEWDRKTESKIASWGGAIRPQSYTPIGSKLTPPAWFDVRLAARPGEPGQGDVDLSFASCLAQLSKVLRGLYQSTVRANARFGILDRSITINGNIVAPLTSYSSAQRLSVSDCFRLLIQRSWRIKADAPWACSEEIEFVQTSFAAVATTVKQAGFSGTPDGDLLVQAVELAAAFVNGVVSDVIWGQRSLAQIDGVDFRQWLVRHGASAALTRQSPLLKALYDTMFQYPDGRIDQASYGAGTATQVLLRMLTTSRGSVAWELQAGSGEVIIAPMFEVLEQRKVIEFKFFHKLTNIALSADRTAIAALSFDRQVDLNPDVVYDPIITRCGMRGFGAVPDWSKIKDGSALERDGVDLESLWCRQKVDTFEIKQGCDFEELILAIPVGAFKDATFGPCHELIQASDPFERMTEKLELVPSLAVQLWSAFGLSALGWRNQKPALVSGPEPLDIWADMSQVLRHEPSGPTSLHYLCDVFETDLHLRPADDQSGVQAQAQALAVQRTRQWLEQRATTLWPDIELTGPHGWAFLYDRNHSEGPHRLSDQYIRANVNPTDCCVATAAGTSAWRLKTDQSGFRHLYLAGSWIDTGFNTDCVETAVISGKQAARAITGVAMPIVGEDFLHPSLVYLTPCDVLRRYVLGG